MSELLEKIKTHELTEKECFELIRIALKGLQDYVIGKYITDFSKRKELEERVIDLLDEFFLQINIIILTTTKLCD